MKTILEIPEKDIRLEFDNLIINKFKIIDSERDLDDEWITIATSNMPDELRKEIVEAIKQYCDH